MSKDSIFEDDELQADALQETDAPAEEVVEEQDGPERDEHGRFKAKEPDEGEPDPNVNDEAGEDKPRDNTVPQGALHAERERRKSVEAELKAAREQLEAIANMRKAVAERKPEALPAADDPAAVEHLRTRLAEVERGQTQTAQRMDMADLDQRETQQLGALMATSEAAYRETQPDYDDAIAHVVNARAQELQLYGLNPADINRTITEECADIVRTAVQRGMDPAEMGYKIAVSRGYRPAQTGQQPGGAAQGGAQATVDAIAKAQGASKSLGSGGGSTAHQLNADALASMDAEEFEAMYSTPEGRALIDATLGG